MAVVTITILQLVAAGRPDNTGWMPILAIAVLWGAAVFVIAWPLSALLRRGWHPVLAWLEAGRLGTDQKSAPVDCGDGPGGDR